MAGCTVSLMTAFLRRQVTVVLVVLAAFVVGGLVGVSRGIAASLVAQQALQVAAAVGGLYLLWRFFLVLVSIDPDKPRAVSRQNRSASEYGVSARPHT